MKHFKMEILDQDSESAPMLVIPESEIQAIAGEHMPDRSLLKIVLHQMRYEILVRVVKKANFRLKNNSKVVQVYSLMSISEFEGINARQQWANWRTIPRNLNGHVLNHALTAIDLCCGTGQSTEVLARYLPIGSQILGLEYNPDFLIRARNRNYRDAAGSPALVSFNTQSVLEAFRFRNGKMVTAESVDIVNCSGAVGSHFNSETTAQLVLEITRVLRRGGIAMIDSGFKGTSPLELTRICARAGLHRIHSSRSCLFDLNPQIVFRKES